LGKLMVRVIFISALVVGLAQSLAFAAGTGLFCGKSGRTYVISNRYTSVAIAASDLTLASLKTPGGANLVTQPGWSVFRVALTQEPGQWYVTRRIWSVDGQEARKKYARTSIIGDTATLELHFDSCTADTTGHAVDVVVSISLDASSKYALWNLSVRNASAYRLGEIRFPVLSGLGSTRPGVEKTEFLAYPLYSGTKNMAPRKAYGFTQGGTDYPGPGCSVQVMTYCDGLDKDALMLSTLDNNGYRKNYESISMEGGQSFTWQVIHYPDGRMENGRWEFPYPVAVGAISGDWYDAAKIYRGWLSKQARWRPIANRPEMPQWFKDLSVWWQGGDWDPQKDQFKSHTQRLKNVRAMMGEDIGFHWYIWQKVLNHDHAYPDYFPAQAGFKESVAEAEKSGIRAMPYINVRLFDEFTDMWKTENAEPWAIPDETGKLYPAIWDNERHMVTMCPGTKYWQDKMVADIERILNDYGPSAVYLDELHVFPYLCYAKNHLHKEYGGTYCVDGYREVLTRVRRDMGDRKIALTGENLSETYADLQDGQLTAHSDQDPYSLPIFQSVMKDATVEMGLTMRRQETADMDCFAARTGFALTRGRQLGWIMFDQADMLAPEYARQVEFLKKCAHCRKAGKDFLLYGEFLRTPVVNAGPMQSVKWDMDKPNYTLPPVMAEAYRSISGDLGIAAVNITSHSRKAEFTLNYKDWPVKKGGKYTMSVWQGGKWSEPTPFTAGEKLSIEIPAYEPVVVRVGREG